MADLVGMRVRLSLLAPFLFPATLAGVLLGTEFFEDGLVRRLLQILLVCGIGLVSAGATRLVVRRSRAAQVALVAEAVRREAAEAELRESTRVLGQREAFLTSLVDILGAEVLAVDTSGRPMLWNAASREAYGSDDVGRRPMSELRAEFKSYDFEGRPLMLRDLPLARALRGEHVKDVPVAVAVPDLPVRYVLMSASPITMPDGEILGAVTAGHDVSTLRARERELERLVNDLDALARAKTAVMSGTDARTAVCQAAREITGATVASLMEPTTDGTALAVTRSSAPDVVRVVLPMAESSRTVTAFRTGRVQIVEDAPEDVHTHQVTIQAVNQWAPEEAQVRSALCVPVLHDGRVRGVLVVAMPAGVAARDKRLIGLLEMLANDAALAIEREDLNRRLSGEALTDPLTALPNRRAWDDALAREVARAERHGRALTVALLDLDRFKLFNDTHGHPAGDALLTSAAGLWRDRLRIGDMLARLGGEEFGVLLPDCAVQHAQPLVQRLLGDLPSGQTCSAGVAQLQGDTPRELLKRADQALYQAKSGGRARLVVAAAQGLGSPASTRRASPSTR